jgi:hypothetical protein
VSSRGGSKCSQHFGPRHVMTIDVAARTRMINCYRLTTLAGDRIKRSDRTDIGFLYQGARRRDAPGATILVGSAKIMRIARSWGTVPAAAAAPAHHVRTATKPIPPIPKTSPQCRPASPRIELGNRSN